MTASAGPTAVWQIGQVAPLGVRDGHDRGHDRPGPVARGGDRQLGLAPRAASRQAGGRLGQPDPGAALTRDDGWHRLAILPSWTSIGSSIPGIRAIGNHPRMQDARRSALPRDQAYQAVDASPTARATGAPSRGTAFQAVSAGLTSGMPVSMSTPRPVRHRPVRPDPVRSDRSRAGNPDLRPGSPMHILLPSAIRDSRRAGLLERKPRFRRGPNSSARCHGRLIRTNPQRAGRRSGTGRPAGRSVRIGSASERAAEAGRPPVGAAIQSAVGTIESTGRIGPSSFCAGRIDSGVSEFLPRIGSNRSGTSVLVLKSFRLFPAGSLRDP